MRALALVLVVGCAEDPELAIVTEPIEVDVVVTPSELAIYLRGDIAGDCEYDQLFPQVGDHLFIDDVLTDCGPVARSCMGRVRFAGGELAGQPLPYPPIRHQTPSPRGTLELVGCGGTATVEIGGVEPPAAPALTATVSDDGTRRIADVAWSSDQRAATHIATLYQSQWSYIDHVTATSNEFATPYPGPLGASVQSLLPVETHATQLGPVRVWYASESVWMQLATARE